MPTARNEAIRWAKRQLEINALILDTETTGLAKESEVVEICLITLNGAPLIDTLIKPSIPMEREAIEVNGITDEMLSDAPTIEEVYEDLLFYLRARPVLAYSSSFDHWKLKLSARQRNLTLNSVNSFDCVMKAYAKFHGEPSPKGHGYKNQKLIEAYRQTHPEASEEQQTHRAYGDCLMTLAVLKYMANSELDNEEPNQ